MKKTLVFLLILSLSFMLFGCMPGDEEYEKEPATLLSGIWHGWIAPLSLIREIFWHKGRIYEANNIGWGYDLGYYTSIIAGFGTLSLTRRRKKH